MAERLIDADVLLKALDLDRPGYALTDKGVMLKKKINSQPYAAYPLEARIKELDEQKDGAYLERNTCVATMARMALMLGYKAVRATTAIEGWSEDWHGCIYIEFPTFQSSWHFHDSQTYLFEFLPEEENQWDGHTTEEKYQNLREWSKGESTG